MDHEYKTAQAWLGAAKALIGPGGSAIRPFDDPLMRRLGFRHKGAYHFISLGTARMAPDDVLPALATPESRRHLLGG